MVMELPKVGHQDLLYLIKKVELLDNLVVEAPIVMQLVVQIYTENSLQIGLKMDQILLLS